MTVYLPRCVRPGTAKLVPVFPGYLFVRPGDDWPKLRNTYGIIDIIMQGDRPAYVPKEVLKYLRSREDKDGVFVLPRQRKPQEGEQVEIKFGPFKNHLGVYNGLSPEGRSRVLVEFMQQTIRLEFGKAHHLETLDGEYGSDNLIARKRGRVR